MKILSRYAIQKPRLTILALSIFLSLQFSTPSYAGKKFSRKVNKPGDFYVTLLAKEADEIKPPLSINAGEFGDIGPMIQALVTGGVPGAYIGSSIGSNLAYAYVSAALDSPAAGSLAAVCGGAVGAVAGSIVGTVSSGTSCEAYLKLKRLRQAMNQRSKIKESARQLCLDNAFEGISTQKSGGLAHGQLDALKELEIDDSAALDRANYYYQGERITSQHPRAKEFVGKIYVLPDTYCIADESKIAQIELVQRISQMSSDVDPDFIKKLETFNGANAGGLKSIGNLIGAMAACDIKNNLPNIKAAAAAKKDATALNTPEGKALQALGINDLQCSICLGNHELGAEVVKLNCSCKKGYCVPCINRWRTVKQICSVCKSAIEGETKVKLGESAEKEEEEEKKD